MHRDDAWAWRCHSGGKRNVGAGGGRVAEPTTSTRRRSRASRARASRERSRQAQMATSVAARPSPDGIKRRARFMGSSLQSVTLYEPKGRRGSHPFEDIAWPVQCLGARLSHARASPCVSVNVAHEEREGADEHLLGRRPTVVYAPGAVDREAVVSRDEEQRARGECLDVARDGLGRRLGRARVAARRSARAACGRAIRRGRACGSPSVRHACAARTRLGAASPGLGIACRARRAISGPSAPRASVSSLTDRGRHGQRAPEQELVGE